MANRPYESIHDGYTIVNGSLSGTAASKVSCWLEYKIVSQSVANNTSTVRFHVFLATSGNTSQFDVYCSNIDSNSRGAMSVSVDGSSVYNRIGRGFAISRIPYRDEYITQYQEPYDTALGYQYLMILTDNASTESEAYGECTVAHNSDGTKQITLAFTANCTYSASIGSANGSVVISLPAIPRITTPTISAVTLGSAATINLTPASSAFLHTLRAKFGSRAETTIAAQTSATNISWTPSLEEANAAPNATSAGGTIYCDTYSSGVLLGTTQVSITAAIPASVAPTGSIWFSEAEEELATQFGCFVQRKSKLSVSISASGVYGSSISSISTTVNGATYSGNSFTTNELTTVGSNTIRATVTDSRGRSAVLTGTFDVVAYDAPSVQSVVVFRSDAAGNANNTGTYAMVAVTGAISSVINKNTRVLKIGYKRKSETYYTDTTFALSAYAVNGSYRIGGSLSNQYTYDIRLTLGDYFGEAYGYVDLSTAEVILSVRSTGMGLAVGKVAEEDSFDVGWPARFRENVQFDDAVTFSSVMWLANLIFPVGSIRMTVSAADESAFLGGTWVRWGTGRVPVGVNTSDANFNTVEKTGGANTHTLATAELPSHNHSFSGSVTVNANGAHTHQASSGSYKVGSGSGSTYYYMTNGGSTSGQTTGSGGSHDHTGSVSGSVGSNGSGAAHNNLQPYITCYFWKRTA
jgi:microcystin-dependent protein